MTPEERKALQKIIDDFLFPKEKDTAKQIALELTQWDPNTKILLLSCLNGLSKDPQQEILDLLLVLKNINPALYPKNPKTKNLVEKLAKTLGITPKHLLVIPEEDFSKENSMTILKGLRACINLVDTAEKRYKENKDVIELSHLDQKFRDPIDRIMQENPQFYRYAEILYDICKSYYAQFCTKRLTQRLEKYLSIDPADIFAHLLYCQEKNLEFDSYRLYVKILENEKKTNIIYQLYQQGWFHERDALEIVKAILNQHDIDSAYGVAKIALKKHGTYLTINRQYTKFSGLKSMLYFVEAFWENPSKNTQEVIKNSLEDLKQYLIKELCSGSLENKKEELTLFLNKLSREFLYEVLITKKTVEYYSYSYEWNYHEVFLELQHCFMQQDDPKTVLEVYDILIPRLEKFEHKNVSKRYSDVLLELQEYLLKLNRQFLNPQPDFSSPEKYDLFLTSWNGIPNLKALEEATLKTHTPLLIQGYNPNDNEKQPLYWIFKITAHGQSQLAQLSLNKENTQGLIFKDIRKVTSSEIPTAIFNEITSKTNYIPRSEDLQKLQKISKRVYNLIKYLFGETSADTKKAAMPYASDIGAFLSHAELRTAEIKKLLTTTEDYELQNELLKIKDEEIILRSEWLTILFDTGDTDFISTQVSGYLHPQTWITHPDTDELAKLVKRGLDLKVGPSIITVYLMNKIKDPLNPELKTTKEIKEQKEVKKTPPGKNFNVSDLVDLSSVYENPKKPGGETTIVKKPDKNTEFKQL